MKTFKNESYHKATWGKWVQDRRYSQCENIITGK